jgi:hypothetical protein
LFDHGKNWKEAAATLKMKPETSRRYYQSWLLIPKDFDHVCLTMHDVLKDRVARNEFKTDVGRELGLTDEEIEQILNRPWGLRHILRSMHGNWKVRLKPSEKELAEFRTWQKMLRRSGKNPAKFLDDVRIVAVLIRSRKRQLRKDKAPWRQ